MHHKFARLGLFGAFVLLACFAVFAGEAPAASERGLHSFSGNPDGVEPNSGLTLDAGGNLYGVTFSGGTSGFGVVYKLTRSGSGYSESILYTFKGGANDGANPSGNLAIAPDGTIFGTTEGGGVGNGVVYELTPSGDTYTETILHAFGYGQTPANAGVIRDKAGNLYGETAGGGTFTDGTVYELKHTASGYKYATLYSFNGNDGNYPSGGLIMDSQGNLYGTTISGGNYMGNVFELKRGTGGTWTENILYTFQNTADGVNPEAALTFDSSGNLYGTTVYGGDTSCGEGFGCGEVFELSPSGGVWTKTTLHAFAGNPDGHAPFSAVTFDAAGNLWGTTLNGGTNDAGALFELSPATEGWSEQIVHSFTDRSDGGYPAWQVTIDAHGNVFGTTQFGGLFGDGLAFAFPGLAIQ